ncbi:bcl-2-interacting killer [Nothobranchius furzeri]|uniref:BCL2-interacting killer (Apoptosis-inducing) n=1 Tax=Nothobranchius furzeri TaxID=105023 RepID=A0A1A8ACF5_NOTFU|nr:bcl-2-interacting killer [Nothobranchius furzeri]XP_054595733.1 bcl-2-interacting killer [Nothobranchius furzeri]
MVEQTRRPNPAVTPQAGPGGVDTSALLDMNRRIRDRDSRVVGRQLAIIGDRLDREWTRTNPNWPPTPLHLLRPVQTLTRTIYRDVHSHMWTFRGLFAAVKAWIVSTMPGQGNPTAEALTAWGSSFKPATCPGWTAGALVAVALLAAASVFSALWVEAKA